MKLNHRHTRLASLLGFVSLLSLGACSDDGGVEGTQGESSESGDGDGDATGDGDGDTAGDGDGDTAGDGDGDTAGDGDGDTAGDGDGDTAGDGDGDTAGDGDGDTAGDGDGDPGGCEAMDAEAIGDCDAILGVAWNGDDCVALSGCECAGEDCPNVFDTLEQCEQAFAECIGPGGCAGLGEEACIGEPNCQAINGRLLEEPPNPNASWCAGASEYLGCSAEQGCGDAISFVCPEGNDEEIFQTIDTCIPEEGWVSCQAPTDEGFYEPC